MSGVNKVILMGRLGQTPELKHLPSGDAFTNLSIATSKKWKDKQGKEQEKTEWHRAVAWRKTAELICKYTQKGHQLYVEGELQTRSYEKDGNKLYATEVVVKDFQFCGSGSGEGKRNEPPPPESAPDGFGPEPTFSENDTIPF